MPKPNQSAKAMKNQPKTKDQPKVGSRTASRKSETPLTPVQKKIGEDKDNLAARSRAFSRRHSSS